MAGAGNQSMKSSKVHKKNTSVTVDEQRGWRGEQEYMILETRDSRGLEC